MKLAKKFLAGYLPRDPEADKSPKWIPDNRLDRVLVYIPYTLCMVVAYIPVTLSLMFKSLRYIFDASEGGSWHKRFMMGVIGFVTAPLGSILVMMSFVSTPRVKDRRR